MGFQSPVIRLFFLASVIVLLPLPKKVRAGSDLGIFEAETDVGTVAPPGSTQFDKASGQYTIKSGGQNIWNKHDDFHFVYRKLSGDLVATAEVSFMGPDTHPHRKAGWMIRAGLEPEAPYVDAMVHGEGLIALQYREKAGDITKDIKSAVSTPAIVRLERHGDSFVLFAAPKIDHGDQPARFQPVASVKLALKNPVYVGLAVCAHDATATETAVIAGVILKTGSPRRPKD